MAKNRFEVFLTNPTSSDFSSVDPESHVNVSGDERTNTDVNEDQNSIFDVREEIVSCGTEDVGRDVGAISERK